MSVVPVAGNPTCADLGLGTFSFKVDPPTSGTYSLDGINSATVTTSDGVYVDWSATIGIDAVIVKGGPNANVYVYSPEASSGLGLSSPINPSTGQPYGLSHVDFCFDYEVQVAKTATPAFDRAWSWTIDKVGFVDTLLLSTGQVYDAGYTVSLGRSSVDSDWSVAGTITIRNPAPFAATLVDVSDQFGVTPVAVDCGPITFPYELASGATLSCTYDLATAGPTNGTNCVEVSTSGAVGPGDATAVVDFATAVITEIDECATVSDTFAGTLGTVCAPGAFQYLHSVGPYETCGSTDSVVNIASFVTNDTAATGSDSWTIGVTVPPCEVGCTLTPGYWKTHSSYGPAPTDDVWLALSAAGPDTPFFSTGMTYYQVLWTMPRGNAYLILAHAYIAAQLDVLNGASSTAISSTLASASTLLATYATVAKQSAVRSMMLSLATQLDNYNNGLIGPGHCNE